MRADVTLTDVVADLEAEIRRPEPTPQGPAKVALLMRLFALSLADICNGCGRAISRSQLHRILRGKPASALERRAIALGVSACLRERCADSAFLFEAENKK